MPFDNWTKMEGFRINMTYINHANLISLNIYDFNAIYSGNIICVIFFFSFQAGNKIVTERGVSYDALHVYFRRSLSIHYISIYIYI